MHLRDYMIQKNLKDEHVAAVLGVNRVSVSRYRRNLARPSWDIAKAIERFTRGEVTAEECMNAIKRRRAA